MITLDDPRVSIIIVNWQHPELIEVCLRTLHQTENVAYEVVVVDNGSGVHTVDLLKGWQTNRLITTLVEERVNHYFSGGHNIGARHTNPASEFLLLLNSDVAFRRPDWLTKMLQWMDGSIEATPDLWCTQPTVSPGPLDIVTLGWSYQQDIEPGHCRPEGWCYLVKREWWLDLDENFPMAGGLEHATADAIRAGAQAGCLFNYSSYLVHREQGSHSPGMEVPNWAQPDIPGWFNGLKVHTLDFTLGPNEHSTYMNW